METRKQRYYDWQATFSRQTGSQGEFCIVVGAKGIGKTFGLRKQCVSDYIRHGWHFCEVCRTKDEMKVVRQGYFDKLQNAGLFPGYLFRVTGQTGYIAKEPEKDPETGEYAEKPQWDVLCYFVALTAFQAEKKRTYTDVRRFIFDEAIIDRKDRYHRYLPNEFLIFANLLDSISRQQPGGDQYRVYVLGNACDLTCPYMRYLGIDRIPEFGYSFWHDKSVLLHYVEPWDKEDRETQTLVGRMLSGTEESEMVFGNVFSVPDTGDVQPKTKNAKYAYAIRYGDHIYAVWIDYGKALCFITSRLPKDAGNVFAITKADASLDYQAIERTSPYLQMLNRFFYMGTLRYESPAVREMFLAILEFMGIR
jgi:hypothetical protein